MGDRLRVAVVLVVVGLGILVLSAVADLIGIGQDAAFGWVQIVGVLVGAGIAVVGGAYWWLMGKGQGVPEERTSD